MMRIGLLYPTANPTSPADWSGIPHGLAEGFQRQGMEVVPIPFRMPARIRLIFSLLRRARGVSKIVAEREPVYAKARSKCIAAALRQLGHLDAVVAMGADLYDLPLVMHNWVAQPRFKLSLPLIRRSGQQGVALAWHQ